MTQSQLTDRVLDIVADKILDEWEAEESQDDAGDLLEAREREARYDLGDE